METTNHKNKTYDEYLLKYIHILEAINIVLLPDDQLEADVVIGFWRNRPNPYLYKEYDRPSNIEAKMFARGIIMKNIFPDITRCDKIHQHKKFYIKLINYVISINQRRLNGNTKKEIKGMARYLML